MNKLTFDHDATELRKIVCDRFRSLRFGHLESANPNLECDVGRKAEVEDVARQGNAKVKPFTGREIAGILLAKVG